LPKVNVPEFSGRRAEFRPRRDGFQCFASYVFEDTMLTYQPKDRIFWGSIVSAATAAGTIQASAFDLIRSGKASVIL